MENTKAPNYRWHAINSLQDRASQSKLWGLGVFISMTIAFALSSILLVNAIRYTETNLLMVEKQPLLISILANGILVSLYLALLASISVSRELDKGTLETLLYGPVDELTYILGSFIAHVKVFSLTLLGALIWSNLCVWLLNLSFRLDILGLLLASLFMAAELIAFGLFSAIWGGKTRNALINFILIVLFLGGVQIADFIVSGLVQIQTSTISDPLIVIRNVLASLNSTIRWISPFSQVQRAMQALINQQTGEFILNMGLMLLECALLLVGAILLLKKKGVRGVA